MDRTGVDRQVQLLRPYVIDDYHDISGGSLQPIESIQPLSKAQLPIRIRR
jgi:hypothetical protein